MSVDYIKELVDIDSVSGYTERIIAHLQTRLEHTGWILTKNQKGALLVSSSSTPRLILAAHIDTLGGMVSKIKNDGQLEITQIGGWPVNSFEGEYVTILTSEDKKVRGTFLLNDPAAHVNHDIEKTERKMNTMHIRLDAESESKKETEKLGI
ncbi:MAG: glucanase, partial [Candidatus Marinimicrobia bacterium]|nr:glucanase [Candidatus Neomarinimicrobiota bacterium]